MSASEKYQMLDNLIKPFGYQYFPKQDIFFSSFDAWQRKFGYTHSYDCLASYFNMVFDSEPVYFNYENHTWLIEFWKGQYGINTGAEIGIYRADGIVAENKRKKEFFHTIPDEEIPVFLIRLHRNTDQCAQTIADLSMPHWWLAVFQMGCFSKPDDLCAEFGIQFSDEGMAYAFYDALVRLGYDPCSLQICDSHICFTFQTPHVNPSCSFFAKPIRFLAQWENRFYCRLYRLITRPFCHTADRLLYLYYYLPFAFRRCLRPRKYRRRS